MRLKSELWVKAYLRGCASQGAAAVVVHRGDTDAGVIYIKIAHLNGVADLYGPGPAGLVERNDRDWVPVRTAAPEADVDALVRGPGPPPLPRRLAVEGVGASASRFCHNSQLFHEELRRSPKGVSEIAKSDCR